MRLIPAAANLIVSHHVVKSKISRCGAMKMTEAVKDGCVLIGNLGKHTHKGLGMLQLEDPSPVTVVAEDTGILVCLLYHS